MAGKATTVAYGTPFKYAAGGLWLTATQIEITAATGEYPKGGIALVPASLGLTVGLVAAAWCTPLAEKKVKTEKEGGFKVYPASVRLYGEVDEAGGQIFLYEKPVFIVETNEAAKKSGLELEEAEGKSLGEYTSIVYAIGR